MLPRHATHIANLHKLEPKKVTRRFANATEDFADKVAVMKFDALEDGTFHLITNRQDLRILEKIVASEHAVTITTILPGYADKMTQDAERFTPYYESTCKRADMLVKLLNQIKARLG